MWPLKSAQLQWGPTNITSFASPCHTLDRQRVEREEGLSTRSKGTDGSGQMWDVSLVVQKNRGFVITVANRGTKSCVTPENELGVSGSERQLPSLTAGLCASTERGENSCTPQPNATASSQMLRLMFAQPNSWRSSNTSLKCQCLAAVQVLISEWCYVYTKTKKILGIDLPNCNFAVWTEIKRD